MTYLSDSETEKCYNHWGKEVKCEDNKHDGTFRDLESPTPRMIT